MSRCTSPLSCNAARPCAYRANARMTIIDTLSLRNKDAVAKLIDVLNELARVPKRDVTDLLWGKADKP